MEQTEAAALFSVRQPDISKILRGEFRQSSVGRLLRFLVKLDQDVEIVVKPSHGKSPSAARVLRDVPEVKWKNGRNPVRHR